MKTFLITLHLVQSSESYVNLNAYLKSSSHWAIVIPNVWIIRTDKKASEIRDGITQRVNVNQGDKVLVMRLEDGMPEWGTNNIGKVVTDWMKNGGHS